MSETIEAKELQLVSVFNDSYRFEVPENQRPYAWTTEQTGELLDDLLHAMEHVESVRDASPYFLGSIVTIKNGPQPHAQIVDGQQRLTTLTILLCVLRELASEESDRGDIHSYVYAPGRESAGIPGHYRLAVRERDREFFQNNVQQMGRLRSLLERSPANLSDSQQRMLENARHLFSSLAGQEERRRKILMQFLAQRCYLVVVSASDQNSVYRIFSAKGREQSQQDEADRQSEQSAYAPPPAPPVLEVAENAIQPGPIHHLLKQHFGYDEFLPFQEEIIAAVIKEKDALVLMPTGGGKSLCYQLPAMHFEGLTLVVSPLISLMKDQVDALRANNIPAAFINSTLSPSEIERVQRQAQSGVLKILYAAPERLSQPEFQQFLATLHVRFVAVDEAHCISMWGHEFRPDYRRLGDLRRSLPGVPFLALTATATEQVRADIVRQLHLQQPQLFVASFNRPNLSYTVLPKRKDSFARLTELLQEHKGEPVIIYRTTRKDTEHLAFLLRDKGFNAQHYHAGLEDDERHQTQEYFMQNRTPIIVATIAFGMGIDKSNVRLIVHFDLPKTLEGYYQETGRAGRDGLPSDCVLFFSYDDVPTLERFIKDIEDENIRRYAQEKLEQVIEFCELQACRRRYLLRYFGEAWTKENCGGCDFCRPATEEFDATAITHLILSAVIQTGERFGITHVAAVLRGSGNKVVRRLGHDALSVYGTVDSYSVDEIKEIAGHLVEEGLLRREDGMYPTLSVTAKGRRFLKSRAKLVLSLPASDERRAPTAGRAGRDNEEARRRRRQRTVREGSTYETTRQLWKQGLTVEEIAKERNLEMSTIASHFERLIEAGMDIDLRPMLPPAEKVAEIRRALTAAGVSPLSQVKELLGDDYSYFEIRIVQVFLRQQRRRSG